ncbi:MAG: GpE family phage tail protein [Dehalococcoidia bacterium]|nr:GpE family phage tail protein [Dehalococcoidia bacterium]
MAGYPLDRLYEEVAYLAFHFHWQPDELLNMEHSERRRWVEQVAAINKRLNEQR